MGMPPIIRISIENMRYEVMHCLVQHGEEINAEVDRQFKEFIENYDIAKEVRVQVDAIMRQAMANALKDAVNKALYSKDVKKILDTQVHSALLKVLGEYYPWAKEAAEGADECLPSHT